MISRLRRVERQDVVRLLQDKVGLHAGSYECRGSSMFPISGLYSYGLSSYEHNAVSTREIGTHRSKGSLHVVLRQSRTKGGEDFEALCGTAVGDRCAPCLQWQRAKASLAYKLLSRSAKNTSQVQLSCSHYTPHHLAATHASAQTIPTKKEKGKGKENPPQIPT